MHQKKKSRKIGMDIQDADYEDLKWKPFYFLLMEKVRY